MSNDFSSTTAFHPPGVRVIHAPKPRELSGVAAVPDGYAIVGDGNGKRGRIWPSGTKFALPDGLKGPESIDAAVNPDGEELWLVLGEDRRRLADFSGGAHVFDDDFRETHGRGLEGVAVRWDGADWRVAVLWEGGYFDYEKGGKGRYARPRVATFAWQKGEGIIAATLNSFELQAEKPSKGQRFRAPDLVWDGDGVLVLLASTDKTRKKRRHTWLQRFDLTGRPDGNPYRLEAAWGEFWEGKNWEALDWTHDGSGLVLGNDAKKKRDEQVLAIFRYR
jgi:hypothetical protein